MEGRRLIKGNVDESPMSRTQGRKETCKRHSNAYGKQLGESRSSG